MPYDKRVVKNAQLTLIRGPYHKTVFIMGEFTITSIIYIPPEVSAVHTVRIEFNPIEGYHQYLLLDDWPLRYIFSSTVSSVERSPL